MFIRTTAINKIRSLKKRIKVVQGGTSSGKTYAIIPILIDRACKENHLKITVVAETLPAVKEGAMDIFKTIMLNTNRWIESNWNASTLTYTFGGTKSRIQFKSFDSEGKAKASGKRDILFLNEANHISFPIADALMIRSKETYIDYNPDNEFWVHNEILAQPNSEFLLLTYHDNEGLPPETLEDLMIKKSKAFHNVSVPDSELFLNGNVKNEYWANWWRVYGLGEIGSLDGVVFNNWKIIPELPQEAKYIRSGLDFGFTNDPSALIDKFEIDSVPVYDEVFYEKELTNSQIANKSKDFKRFIVADSAEPKSIKELKALGLRIDGADKGKDSINFGIQQIQNYSFFYVTANSLNLINELRKYKWAVDKQGNKLNIPIDDYNHCFVGNTLIETTFGKKRIDEITENDFVYTSSGVNRVIKKFNNGIKETIELSLQFDTFSLSLQCTENHKIKTTEGWIEAKNLTERHIVYIMGKDIIAEEQKECTGLCGNITMEKYQKDSIYTTLTITKKIIKSKILKWLKEENIFRNISNFITKKILISPKIKLTKIKTNAGLGIHQKRVLNNIGNKPLSKDLDVSLMEKSYVKFANLFSQPKRNSNYFVQTNAKVNTEDYQELMTKVENVGLVEKNLQSIGIQKQKIVAVRVLKKQSELVYDLMIEKNHEYFANGLLVHNCIDPIRYIETYGAIKPPLKIRTSRSAGFRDFV